MMIMISTLTNVFFFSCRTRQLSREEKTLKSFLDMSVDKWAESSYEVGAMYLYFNQFSRI